MTARQPKGNLSLHVITHVVTYPVSYINSQLMTCAVSNYKTRC